MMNQLQLYIQRHISNRLVDMSDEDNPIKSVLLVLKHVTVHSLSPSCTSLASPPFLPTVLFISRRTLLPCKATCDGGVKQLLS